MQSKYYSNTIVSEPLTPLMQYFTSRYCHNSQHTNISQHILSLQCYKQNKIIKLDETKDLE